MTKYCDCGAKMIHRKGSGNWECPSSPKKCLIWAKKFDKFGKVIQTTRMAIPRSYDIIGEM